MDRENEENEPLTNLYNFEDLKAGLEDDTDKEVSEEIRPKVAYGYIEDEGYYEGEDDSEDGYEGGVFEKYDRDSDMNGPSEELKDYAQQAIANYNEGKRKSQHYSVVDIMRAELYQVNGFLVFMHFTAKQGDSDAIYFRAQLWDKCDEPYANEVMFIGPITEEEVASKQLRDTSRRFLLGLEKHGKGDWRNISRNYVISKTPTQVASHAQKYYLRQQISAGKDKRRPSIHDITTVNLTAVTSPPETQTIPPKSNELITTAKTTGFDWNNNISLQCNNGNSMVFGSSCGDSYVAYPHDFATCGGRYIERPRFHS